MSQRALGRQFDSLGIKTGSFPESMGYPAVNGDRFPASEDGFEHTLTGGWDGNEQDLDPEDRVDITSTVPLTRHSFDHALAGDPRFGPHFNRRNLTSYN